MDKERMQSFIARITQASQTGLVVITYDIILEYLNSATNLLKKDDIVSFEMEIIEAQKFLRNLQDSLDMNVGLSRELMALYIYCNKQLIDARIKKDSSYLDIVTKVITNLCDGYIEVNKKDNSSIMTNTEQIYAGLTYGKKSLNETTLYSEQRGYKA